MKKILVTAQIPKEGLEELFKTFNVTYPDKPAFSQEDILSIVAEYDGILASTSTDIGSDIIDKASKLKIISNFGVGYDNVNINYATKKGIVVTNTPNAVTEATAEIAFGLMLSVMRRIAECDRKLRTDNNFVWGTIDYMGHSLYGKTLGIIGMGRIGKAVSKRAVAFGMKVLYYNRTRLDRQIEESLGASYIPFNELLENCDVISIHTPLNNDTYHLIGKRELEMIKPSAYIINSARGRIIDEKALIDSLIAGRIAGAGLDVFEDEPVIPKELIENNRIVITPHIGTDSIETSIRMGQDASKNILDYFTGIKPVTVVNPEVYSA